MKRPLCSALAALLAACSSAANPQGPGALGPCVGSDDFACANTVNGVVLPMLARDGIAPKLAPDTQLCRRYVVDLTGMAPTWQEYEDHCAGKRPAEMVDYFIAQPRYVSQNQRIWADAFQLDNARTWYPYNIDLDALAGKLYRGELGYADFATQAVVHPAFLSKFVGENVIAYAFQAFLGRDALPEERQDLLGLYRPWVPRALLDPMLTTNHYNACTPGPTACVAGQSCRLGMCVDAGGASHGECGSAAACPMGQTCTNYCFADTNVREYYVDPARCAGALGEVLCTSAMHGITMQVPGAATRWNDLSPDQLHALEAPGRLLASSPLFWEAAVDTVLKRTLGWWHSGIELPGYEIPEVRQALALFFQQKNGDARALDREVLTSVLYTMDAQNSQADAKLWHYGPTKQMMAEAWLDSVGHFIGASLGSCDWRFPNATPRWLPPALKPGPGVIGGLDYTNEARVLGGCSDQIAQFRFTDIGVLSAMEQRKVIAASCIDSDATRFLPAPGVDAATFVRTLYHEAFTWDPNDDEISRVAATLPSMAAPAEAKTVAQTLCQGLLRSGRFLFY